LREALFPLTVSKPYPDRVIFADGHFFVLQMKERSGLDERDFTVKKEALKKSLLDRRKNDVLQAWVEGTKAALMKEGRLTIQKDLKEI